MIITEVWLLIFTAIVLPLLHFYFLSLIDDSCDPLIERIHVLENDLATLELRLAMLIERIK